MDTPWIHQTEQVTIVLQIKTTLTLSNAVGKRVNRVSESRSRRLRQAGCLATVQNYLMFKTKSIMPPHFKKRSRGN